MNVTSAGRIMIAGGTGTLGGAVARSLDHVGADYLPMSRCPGPNGRVVDLQTGAGLASALAGVDTVINCASRPGHDKAISRGLLTEAERAGVSHLVHISIVGVDVVPLKYYREKVAVEQMLAASPVPTTLRRATQFHTLLDWLFAKLAKGPVMLVPSASLFQPVAVDDVARRLVELSAEPPAGRAADFGGPEVRSAVELARIWLSARGRTKRVLSLRAPGQLAAAVRAGGLVTPDHCNGTTTFGEFVAASQSARVQ